MTFDIIRSRRSLTLRQQTPPRRRMRDHCRQSVLDVGWVHWYLSGPFYEQVKNLRNNAASRGRRFEGKISFAPKFDFSNPRQYILVPWKEEMGQTLLYTLREQDLQFPYVGVPIIPIYQENNVAVEFTKTERPEICESKFVDGGFLITLLSDNVRFPANITRIA